MTPSHKTARMALVRHGSLNPLLLLVMVVFLAAMAFAVDLANLWTTRTEMQRAADAAALGAAQTLVDDAFLRSDLGEMAAIQGEAKRQADWYANTNTVFGTPLQLQSNPDNSQDGDLVLGYLDSPRSHQFVLAEPPDDRGAQDLRGVNAVRVVGRRTRARGNAAGLYWARLLKLESADVLAAATAMLDHSVIGFRPVGSIRVPLAPIALLSDPSFKVQQSWEAQVEGTRGVDDFRFDRKSRRYLVDARGDGIYEMTVTIAGTTAQRAGTNTCLLTLGAADSGALSRQLREGLAPEDLDSFGGQLVLNSDGRISAGGGLAIASERADVAELAAVLQELADRGIPRVWPLFTAFDVESGQATVNRFVAARVVCVQPATDGTPLTFVLQPCMLATVTAITEAKPGNSDSLMRWNRYVCKLRLVE